MLVKKGLRLEHSLCRASRNVCAPSTKRTWFQRHSCKMPLTEPPPGCYLGVSVLPQPHLRNQGAWPALMVPSHGITVVRLEKPSKLIKPNHQAAAPAHPALARDPRATAMFSQHLQGWWLHHCSVPGLDNPSTICRKSSSNLNLQWTNLSLFPQELPEEVSLHISE